MVKVGRRFFFNQTFQKKQRRLTIIVTIAIIVAILITFTVTSYFHDSSSEKGKKSYVLKDDYSVEVFTKMPSYLNYFSKIENIPLDSIKITYDQNFSYDENGESCSDEELELINSIRNGQEKAPEGTDPFACLVLVPNKVGSYSIKITVGKEENSIQLNVIDNTPPEFVAHDLTISNEETYSADSFISNCEDNSKTDCHFDFYHPLRGEIIDYSKYKNPGEYDIKVVAKDDSGNTTEPQDVKLIITEIRYYKVTFNANGGSSVEPQTIREGEKVYSPYTSKPGYSFEGWYNGNSKYNFDNPLNSDLTLTAKWKANSSSGGGGSSSGGGSSRGGGGGSSSKCSYGKYTDYSKSVSMYATVLNGKSLSDCADQNNTEDYNMLKEYVDDIADNLIEFQVGAIDKDARSLVGGGANINYLTTIKQVVNSSGGLVGVLVEINASLNNQVFYTYTLYDCNSSSCKWR